MTEAQLSIILANIWSAAFVVRPSMGSAVFTLVYVAFAIYFKVHQ